MNSKLKIVHVSTYLGGGAGSAANRLHQALIANNVDSAILTCGEISNEKRISKLTRNWASLPKRIVNKIVALIFNNGTIAWNKRHRYYNKFAVIEPQLQCELASIPYTDYNVLNHPLVQSADIIHLHFVAGMLDYPSFFKTNKKPVVWTFHDLNPLQGIFHYKEDELVNAPVSKHFNQAIVAIKREAVQQRHCSMKYITPSAWLYKLADDSPIFKNVSGNHIFNTIDLNVFYPKDVSNLKKEMNIPDGNTVFLFIAEKLKVRRKGFDILVESLNMLSGRPVTLLVVGEGDDFNIAGLDVRLLGSIKSADKLSEYYSLAEAFIIPSREDNLPNVMLESFACGTPVIGFNVGGLSSVLVTYFNGIKVNEISAEAFGNALKEFIACKANFDANAIRKFALDNFSFGVVARQHINVYNQLLI